MTGLNATPIVIAIVNLRNTDRFGVVYGYADQSESNPTGNYESYDAAYASVEEYANELDIEIEDRTIDDYNG